ncbi:pilus assembly protein PilV [Pseudomonas sp. PIC25]|uniref:shufflon system plasmid conjugative transfer pilus tip adhesin PilV n=1 Tax=Pseudomonas sp. PIC25 TaxID=1958773 RepID=UPI000BABD857|nr:shufflon system plasmid conjugative transfer pilus tip adhesin PilV [Pseudomonas sp. PIC25]PAU63310.1 pilus assembly protein PilV [Pseudomonas sp. PIC25]
MDMRRNSGFVSIEIMVVLIVIALAIVKGTQLYMEYLDGLNQQMAAQQQMKVAEAGSKYIKDNFAAVLAAAGPTTPAVITVAMLKNTHYLPAGFSDKNIYGQDYRILTRKPQANQLETLIVTTGGSAAGEIDIRRVAQIIGAQGGYISSTNTTVAQGAAWQVPLSNYGVSPGAGRLATALFFQDGAIANDYLYRNAVPGRPELNRMNTALNMGGNNIEAAGTVNATGNVNAQNLNAQANITAQNADIGGETYTNGWFRTRGDGGWYSEKWGGGWYMSDSTWVRSWLNKSIYTGGQVRGGEVRSDGRTYVGEYLQLGGVATEGADCAPNGLIGRNAVGLTLSCQSEVWKPLGGVSLGAAFYGSSIGYDPKDGGTAPYDASCPPDTVMVGLRNITNGDYYHLICRPL